jgi:hypothetical protein
MMILSARKRFGLWLRKTYANHPVGREKRIVSRPANVMRVTCEPRACIVRHL